jgi:hypothetical protein
MWRAFGRLQLRGDVPQGGAFLVHGLRDAVLSVLMWGVNHTMGELDCVPAQPLIMASDFKAFSKASIHNSGYNECGAGLLAGPRRR